MLRFETSLFAVAGIIASVVPIIIHLLYRRRFKTVSWAAMDFLHDALKRNRKSLRIRDALLLAARILTVIFVGIVLSKPVLDRAMTEAFWPFALTGFVILLTIGLAVVWATSSPKRSKILVSGLCFGLIASSYLLFKSAGRSSGEDEIRTNARTPVHAILVIDNSRSMGVESFGGTLLDRAKTKAAEFIEILPPDSRISVIPMAGSEDRVTLDAYRSKDDSRQALHRIKLVDVAGNVRTGLEQAEAACQQAVDPPTKRVVLFTDTQANTWRGVMPDFVGRFRGIQIVNLGREDVRNVWVSGFHLEDGLSSCEVPGRFLARVKSNAIASTIDQSSRSETFDIQATLLIDETQVSSQTVTLSLGQEREIEFNYQFEQQADPLQADMAVATLVIQADLPSVDELLADNRQQIVVPIVSSLPVIFVDQFGDNENLDRNQIGETYALRHLMAPRSSTEESPRRLIHVDHLRPEQVTQQRLQSAKLVVVAGLETIETDFVQLLREFVRRGGPLVILAGGQFDPAAWTDRAWLSGQGILPVPLEPHLIGHTPEETTQSVKPFFASFESMQHDFFQIEGEDPDSLSSLFASTPFFKAIRADMNTSLLAELAGQSPPKVLATFDVDQLPFVIERRIGAGRVVLFTSGVTSNWNLMRSSGAMYLFHRTFCQLIEQTFPVRTFAAGERISFPIERRPDIRYLVTRPSGVTEPLAVDPIAPAVSGFTIRHPLVAGSYRVTSEQLEMPLGLATSNATQEIIFAVNGAESESDLSAISTAELNKRIGHDNASILNSDDAIQIDGGIRNGRQLWQEFGWCLLGSLLFEQTILTRPHWKNWRRGLSR